MAEIITTHEWDGKTIHKECKGFTGTQCIAKTRFVEEALGKAGERKMTGGMDDDKRRKQNNGLFN